LANLDGALYAADADLSFVARSEDGGRTWQTIDRRSIQPLEIFHDVPLPLEICYPVEARLCYRISGKEEIEASSNGGQSWEVVWSIPLDRRAFMQRLADWQEGWKQIDLGPYDMISFEQGNTHYLLVAMGNEGVMRRRLPDGDWERYAVWTARPTPYVEKNIVEVLLMMQHEVDLWIGIALLTLLGSCAMSWKTMLERLEPSEERDLFRKRGLVPVVAMVCLGLLSIFVYDVAGFSVLEAVLSFLVNEEIRTIAMLVGIPLGLGVVTAIGSRGTWRYMTRVTRNPYGTRTIASQCVFTSVSVFLSGMAPWPLWARQVIASYEHAFALSVLLATTLTAGGLYWIRFSSKRVAILPAG
jgi:hypothetical protein